MIADNHINNYIRRALSEDTYGKIKKISFLGIVKVSIGD